MARVQVGVVDRGLMAEQSLHLGYRQRFVVSYVVNPLSRSMRAQSQRNGLYHVYVVKKLEQGVARSGSETGHPIPQVRVTIAIDKRQAQYA